MGIFDKNRDGLVFGPDGVTSELGEFTFTPDGRSHYGAGNTMFSSDGTITQKNGGTTFQHRGQKTRQIRRVGDMWYAGSDRYRLSGSILFGPHGKMWQNVNSAEAAERIIETDF